MAFQADDKSAITGQRPTGFTLVELLVVSTIIAILIALLLPAVQLARELGRRSQCTKNTKELALAALAHESVIGFFPTGGWDKMWLGHPDRGFNKRQPGGWIYNILPFIEQQSLHDLGAGGSGTAIEQANLQRVSTPLPGLNCPSRRPAALFRLAYAIQFRLTSGLITRLARSDYAMNAGDYVQWRNSAHVPSTLEEGDQPAFPWDDMSHQTGISYQRSQVTVADISDGTSNTFLVGEKYISVNHYIDGKDLGDSETMYCGDDLDLLRWTGIDGTVGTSTNNNLPVRDRSVSTSEGNRVQWFGSPHANMLNMSLCDGSARSLSYSIDAEVYRRLGNRKDGLIVNGSQF
jgi:prepilin-type N-terminal cleavage/methylation domain-containing protein